MTLRFDKQAKPALFVACAVLLVCWGGFYAGVQALNIYLHKERVELRGFLDTIPTRLGAWRAQGKDQLLDEAMIEELGTNKYLQRTYALEDNPAQGMLNVHLAYYTGMIDAVPHVPDRCLVAGGYNAKTLPRNLPFQIDTSAWQYDPTLVNRATGKPYPFVKLHHDFYDKMESRVLMPVDDFELRTTEFEKDNQPGVRVFAGYFFIANGRVTATPTQVRMLAFRASEKYAYYCKVQFTYFGADVTEEKFVAMVSEFLKDFLPELMQRLPDWSEVERRDAPGSATASVQ